MKNYERVLALLKYEFGWDLTDSLTKTGKKLVMDTLKANNIIESNPDAYKETHRDGSIAVIEKPEFPHNREKPTNGLQKLLLWIDKRREAIKAEEKIYHMNWPKDGVLENLPNNLQKDKNLQSKHIHHVLHRTDCTCKIITHTYDYENEKFNEVLRDKDKIIESLEREVKKLNAIIKENL